METTFFGSNVDGKDSWTVEVSALRVAKSGTDQAAYDLELSGPLGRMSSYTKTLFELARQEFGL
jgi:hypothetical protein